LQAADKRLEPLNLPRANQLRETLGLEIEGLRKLPQVDVLGMSTQLETLANLCATIPLISERQPTLNAKATQQNIAKPLHQNTLQKIAYPIWEDIKNLVTVERIDKPEPPLLSVDYEFYLRENLKLRLLTARVALLQHDEASYKADLATVSKWINQYYDAKHPNAIQAFKLLKQLSGNNIDIELPQLTESIAAVNRYKLSLEKTD
jgi:uroporphyrin-3 C-methyltransferase